MFLRHSISLHARHRVSLLTSSSFPVKAEILKTTKTSLAVTYQAYESQMASYPWTPEHDKKDDDGNKDDHSDDGCHQPEGHTGHARAPIVLVAHRPLRII